MASSSTATTLVTSTTTTTASPSASSTTGGQASVCSASSWNSTGLNGPVCSISTFQGPNQHPLPNIASCCVTPTDIRTCGGNSTLICEAVHSNSNVTMTQEQTTDCIKNAYRAEGQTEWAFSVSCLNYKDGQVSGAGRPGDGGYNGAVGIWALVMVLGWKFNLF